MNKQSAFYLFICMLCGIYGIGTEMKKEICIQESTEPITVTCPGGQILVGFVRTRAFTDTCEYDYRLSPNYRYQYRCFEPNRDFGNNVICNGKKECNLTPRYVWRNREWDSSCPRLLVVEYHCSTDIRTTSRTTSTSTSTTTATTTEAIAYSLGPGPNTGSKTKKADYTVEIAIGVTSGVICIIVIVIMVVWLVRYADPKPIASRWRNLHARRRTARVERNVYGTAHTGLRPSTVQPSTPDLSHLHNARSTGRSIIDHRLPAPPPEETNHQTQGGEITPRPRYPEPPPPYEEKNSGQAADQNGESYYNMSFGNKIGVSDFDIPVAIAPKLPIDDSNRESNGSVESDLEDIKQWNPLSLPDSTGRASTAVFLPKPVRRFSTDSEGSDQDLDLDSKDMSRDEDKHENENAEGKVKNTHDNMATADNKTEGENYDAKDAKANAENYQELVYSNVNKIKTPKDVTDEVQYTEVAIARPIKGRNNLLKDENTETGNTEKVVYSVVNKIDTSEETKV